MKDKHVSIPMTILSLAIGIIVIFPIIWLVLSSFKPSGELFTYPLHMFPSAPTTEHYKSVLDGGFMGYVKNSLFLAVVGTLITLLISAMCGYALAIYRFEIKYVNLVFGVFLLGTLIPGETLTVPQFSVISAMGLYNNIWGVILPVVTTTTGIFMYRQHYMSLPLSLVEAARIDGASEWKIFSHIMLPLGSNVTITLTIFSFMWRWNDYILPLLVLSDQKKYTIQIAIKNFIGNTGVDWSSILAASVLSILPIVILFMILQKYIVGGVSAGGVKGRSSSRLSTDALRLTGGHFFQGGLAMKYGCRAHDYGCFTAQELAKVLADNGYNAAQLAMPKAIQGIKSLVAVTPEQLEDVRSAFAAANIEITVLSCYQDLSNPDAEVRRSAVSSVFSALKCQVTLGAGQVGSESACRDLSPEEKAATLPLLTDSILRIVEQAAQIGGCFALEPVYTHTLGTLEALQKLKETVADPQHFHIIFDPVNVLTADTAAHQAEFWPGWCEVIGKDLACIHMKDALFVPNAPRIPTPLGEGQMDYTILRDWLHREHPDAALLRDEVILSAAQRDLNFIRAM